MMMEDDLEQRLLGVSGTNAMENETVRGLQRYNTEQRNGGSPGKIPQLRDLRKKRPSTANGSSTSGDEALSPRLQPAREEVTVANPFDDPPPTTTEPQPQTPSPPQPQSPPTSGPRPEEAREEAVPVEDEPLEEKTQRLDAQRRDEESLARVQQRMGRLWKLEEDHSTLTRRYARLEEAKKKTDAERDEWQRKHEQLVEENKRLEEKCALLEREKQESEKANQKLNKKLDGERERYALLSSQFNELNAKMVEIINNVTNLKLDEIEQEKEARRLGAPLPKKKPPPPTPIAQSAAAYFGFASPSKPSTPTKPKGPATPSKPRE